MSCIHVRKGGRFAQFSSFFFFLFSGLLALFLIIFAQSLQNMHIIRVGEAKRFSLVIK